MRKKPSSALVFLLLCTVPAQAQFYTGGNEPTAVKWSTIGSNNYRFVYPEGCDSLARAYALEWERVRGAVGFSSGLLPNESYRRPMPVILHPYLGYSNGFVVWTPRRMEMFTGPEMYSPDPIPWMTMLALHEGRHVSQMQYVGKGWMRALSFVCGEIPAGLSLFFTEPSFLEGDAVATETGLTRSGRGRTADFLEYYRASLDEGEPRNYYRWRYGSQKLFTPDYYKVGYLTMAGLRTWGGRPDIVKDHLREASEWGFDSFDFNRRVKRETGRSLSRNFDEILSIQGRIWKEDADSRAPFMPCEQLTDEEDYFVEYKGLAASSEGIYAIRSGTARARQLVFFDPSERSTRTLSDCAASSRLALLGDLVLWTEALPDLRWEMKSSSALRCFDGKRNRTLVGGSRLFNPSVSPDGARVALCASPTDGSQAVELYSSDGLLLESHPAPSGLQPYECCWLDGELYLAVLCAEGEGLWRLSDWSCVLEPSPVKINHIFTHEGRLCFVSDRTGVNELYSLEPDSGRVHQLSNLRGGATDFVFHGQHLYYTVLSTRGRMICRTPADVLPVREVDFSQRYSYPLADSLSALEQGAWAEAADSVVIEEPKRYSKGAHALKIHSWLPFYIDADDVVSMSLSSVTLPALLGASVMFQNDLNTLYGSVGFNVAEGFAGHFTYSGLYPKFEVRFASGLGSRKPYASVKTYVPLNFTSDGWRRAVIPSATLLFNSGACVMSAGVRAYAVQNIPASCIYPKWGIGAEAGVRSGSYLYSLLYGYLPGFHETHGFSAQLYYEAMSRSASASVSYAMPVLPVDWDALSPLVYVKNFELIPFWGFNHSQGLPFIPLNFHTVGASFAAVLGNFWLVPYDIHLGLRYAWRINMENPHSWSLVFSVDI